MSRSYYSDNLQGFLNANRNDVLSTILKHDTFEPDKRQQDAWREQIDILQDQLRDLESGYIMFEYTIPRMGKRVDVILLYSDFVFVMEFKVNKKAFLKQDMDQCIDYALDLKHFHEESHCASIVPMLVSTKAKMSDGVAMDRCDDGIYDIACANEDNIIRVIRHMHRKTPDCPITAADWKNSKYSPTPTIIEAATALCSNIKDLDDITRSGADARNLGVTTDSINDIIERSKKNGEKSICFVTGVPGSGKTLAGLKLACSRLDSDGEGAIFLSGNKTLVEVLKESLVKGGQCMEKYGGAAAASLIQHIPKFRDSISNSSAPVERIIIFDEAQRAWSDKKLNQIREGKGKTHLGMSDPELLIGAMDRHDDWAVIVCLIGEGQEIYEGEVGLSGWLEAIQKKHPQWRVYHSSEAEDPMYLGGNETVMPDGILHERRPGLHLGMSIRSFRGKRLADLVSGILDSRTRDAQAAWKTLEEYPIVITRDIKKAREWVRRQARGTERYGIVASSGAYRLKPHGIFVKSEIKPTKWFLADKDDMRSSYYLEDAATEFYIQGLELDWVCLAWDANLRRERNGWSHHTFHGSKWRAIKPGKQCEYLINAYRVLMTRARQGMIIFVPPGDEHDSTRKPEFYDGTYKYLKEIGFKEI